MISRNSIEQLKQNIDIVDLISNYLELKKSGANYKTKCPFHSEKTSSFIISPSKGIFHCFGCGVGGDAIKFVMEIEKLNYPEAIEKIAFIYNFPLQYERSNNLNNYLKISKVLEVVQKWYRKNLNHNKKAMSYLKDRGVTQALIEDFGIGYAPQKGLIEFLQDNHIPLPQAKLAGVVQERENGTFYARLTDRVTFPIYSSSGLIVGFGGRTLGTHPAKYINSPQTKLFNKSKILYGYQIAKESIYSQKEVIVTEGYFDVIMLHKAGFKRAVATLGTSLTKEHLPLLKKTQARVILAYDGDKAGMNAALKASRLLAQNSFDGGVVLFNNGLDPADMVVNGEVEKLDKLFREAEEFVPFVLKGILKEFDISRAIDKERAFKEVVSFLNTISPIVREAYLDEASLILKLPKEYFRFKNIDFNSLDSNFNSYSTAWGQIIKSILHNNRLLDDLLDILSDDMINDIREKEAIDALIKGDNENRVLISILVDETIKPLDETNFKKALLMQLEKVYLRRLNSIINSKNVSYQYKSYWIRKIKTDILPRIKKGELVVDESNIPF